MNAQNEPRKGNPVVTAITTGRKQHNSLLTDENGSLPQGCQAEKQPNVIIEAAHLYAASGFSVLPTGLDKRPHRGVSWDRYKAERLRPSEVDRVFRGAPGVAVICGKVSGNLEVLDFDAGGALFDEWAALVPADLLERLAIERTPSGGVHVCYRCAGDVSGNSKLAFIIKEGRPEIAIETRGEGGYACTDPTPNYSFFQNTLHALVTVSAEDREILLEAARSLNEHIPVLQEAQKPSKMKPGEALRPGDDFNERGDVRAPLLDAGWTPEGHGNVNGAPAEYWTRPGKKRGRSATLIEGRVFYVFSTNAWPFEGEKAYTAFAVYALLKHSGDFTAAARALAREGYGTSPAVPVTTEGNEISPDDIIKAAFEGQKGAKNLLIRLRRGRLVFDHAAGEWFTWDQHFWVPDPHGEPVAALDDVQALFEAARAYCSAEIVLLAEKLKINTDEIAQRQLKTQQADIEAREKAVMVQVRNLNLIAYRKAVAEFATIGRDGLGISGEEWDRHPWLLPCLNGVVDLRTGKLRPGSPSDCLRTVSPTPYDPNAQCPQWQRTLGEIFDQDHNLVDFMRRILGMSLVGETIEHVLIVLYGAGRNGKDTILSVIGSILGPLAGPVQAELLLDQGKLRSSSGPSADIVALRGRRLAWASETSEGRRMDAGRVKWLTGGGHLVGRAPYGRREMSFPQSHTLLVLTNSKPHAPADDYALWKRIHLVPFSISFVDDPQAAHERKADKGLMEKLKTEAAGILAWMVQGCLEWQREGLSPPAVVQEATLAYKTAEDLIETFLEDVCIKDENAVVSARSLYDTYKAWCDGNSIKPMSGTAFGEKMGRRFDRVLPRIHGKQQKAYKGVGIAVAQ